MTTPANTPTQYYISSEKVASKCHDNFKKIDKECAPEAAREKTQHPMLNKLLGQKNMEKLTAMATKIKGEIPTTNDNRWMDHCHGMWIKPQKVTQDLEEFNKMYDSISKDLNKSLLDIVNPMLDQLKNAAETEAQNYAESQAEKALLREGVEIAAGGGPEDFIADGVAALDRLGTVIAVAAHSPEILAQLKDLMSFKDLATKAIGELSDLAGNAKNLTPTQLMATGMGVLGRLNPCIRARRCLLVEYDKTGTAESLGGHGCCPGQTGHHILPDAMTKGGNCPGYSKEGAPTLCVEGTNNSNGTHGQIHDVLVLQMDAYKKMPIFGGPTMSYETARNKGILSVEETFPESKCSPECLAAQLDAYYEKKCTKQLPAEAGKKSSANDGDSNAR